MIAVPLTVAGRAEVVALALRGLSNAVARGTPPDNLAARLAQYAEVCEDAARELRDPVCRPAGALR